MEDIVIYGAGNMGRAVYQFVKTRCNVCCFVDRNPEMQRKMIFEIPILMPDDCSIERSCIILVAMVAAKFSEVKKYLEGLGYQKVIPAGDYVREFLKDCKLANEWRMNKTDTKVDIIKDLFSDEISKDAYKMAWNWFAYRDDERYTVDERKRYFPEFLRNSIATCEIMFDTALLNGEYVSAFLDRGGTEVYALILASLDADIRNRKVLEKYKKVHIYNFEAGEKDEIRSLCRVGLMEPFVSLEKCLVHTKPLDEIILKRIDYLRIYSIGEALPIINSGKNVIKKYRPLIAVNIGHYEEDFLQIPFVIKKLCKNYKLYFRVHSYQGYDSILYAVPIEKILE